MSLYLYYMLRRDYIYKIKHFFRKYKKIIVIILLLSIGTSYIYKNIQKDLYINFIDVGQGDSTLITTQFNKKILIDGGGSEFGSTFDVGEKTLLPYLLKKKIHKLDYVVISHFDSDHVGGILTILEELNVKQVLIPKQVEYSENYNKFLDIIKKRNIKVKIVGEGNTINIDKNTYLDILWPEEKQITDNVLNNNSLIVRLCYKNFKMLFTGDIEEIAEQKLLQKYENTEKLTADILKCSIAPSSISSTQLSSS